MKNGRRLVQCDVRSTAKANFDATGRQIAQLEKDRDVVAQVEAITALGALPRPTFAAMNALNNCLADGRVSARAKRASK